MRVEDHPILSFEKGEEITIYYEGEPITAHEGETIASALYDNGIKEFRKSGEKNRSRGFFCSIGKCSSCLMKVDGIPNVKTCITMAKEGMELEEQKGFPELPERKDKVNYGQIKSSRTEITVIGGGPAGLKAALTAARAGADITIVDENPLLGGQLIKQTHKFFGSAEEEAGTRGIKIGKELVSQVEEHENINSMLRTSAVGIYDDSIGVYTNMKEFEEIKTDKIIVASGASEKMITFPNNDLPGVYGAGGIQTLMNVYGVKPGNEVLMVGAGNVGLIVAYQLLQAGVNVKAIIEAQGKIGGYYVHAAKVRRFGVPILTNHTVKKVKGGSEVKKVLVSELDENWEFVQGSEKEFSVDTVALAVGLSPSYKLLNQAGCEIRYVPSLGGYVPVRDDNMRTTVEDIYVAGDVSGIEEATTAMLEGEISGASAALSIGYEDESLIDDIEESKDDLRKLRSGPYYEHIREGLKEVVK